MQRKFRGSRDVQPKSRPGNIRQRSAAAASKLSTKAETAFSANKPAEQSNSEAISKKQIAIENLYKEFYSPSELALGDHAETPQTVVAPELPIVTNTSVQPGLRTAFEIANDSVLVRGKKTIFLSPNAAKEERERQEELAARAAEAKAKADATPNFILISAEQMAEEARVKAAKSFVPPVVEEKAREEKTEEKRANPQEDVEDPVSAPVSDDETVEQTSEQPEAKKSWSKRKIIAFRTLIVIAAVVAGAALGINAQHFFGPKAPDVEPPAPKQTEETGKVMPAQTPDSQKKAAKANSGAKVAADKTAEANQNAAAVNKAAADQTAKDTAIKAAKDAQDKKDAQATADKVAADKAASDKVAADKLAAEKAAAAELLKTPVQKKQDIVTADQKVLDQSAHAVVDTLKLALQNMNGKTLSGSNQIHRAETLKSDTLKLDTEKNRNEALAKLLRPIVYPAHTVLGGKRESYATQDVKQALELIYVKGADGVIAQGANGQALTMWDVFVKQSNDFFKNRVQVEADQKDLAKTKWKHRHDKNVTASEQAVRPADSTGTNTSANSNNGPTPL